MSQSTSAPIRAQASEGFASWLAAQPLSLAFSTYRANRLLLLGTTAGGTNEPPQLRLQERRFDRPMGLFHQGDSLWMATRCQIWRLDNWLTEPQQFEGGDRLFVPAVSFTTGDVNAHELVLNGQGEPVFVNTAFSCLAGLRHGFSFAPLWQPSFISRLAADDRCHLNGLALHDGIPTWASACGSGDGASSWRHQRNGGGTILHIPTGEPAASGLAMPHSPRWHQDRLWLLNSGTGELGWIEAGRFMPLCPLPGFARGLAFSAGCAVVGLSKLRSPQFSGLPLEERLQRDGLEGGCCGIRVIELSSGTILHSLDLPDPIDELFDVIALPGIRQPRAIGLQGEEIDCLVRIPEHSELIRVRPLAPPSGQPHQGPEVRPLGLPAPLPEREVAVNPTLTEATEPAVNPDVRYQRVFHLTPANLEPYAALTEPPLTLGSSALRRIQGELLATSAMVQGSMVGLAIAERLPHGGALLLSLVVQPAWRRRKIGRNLLRHLMQFLQQEGVTALLTRYRATPSAIQTLEPVLASLGWSAPQTDALLLQASTDRLLSIPWLRPGHHPNHRLLSWGELSPEQTRQALDLGAPSHWFADDQPARVDLKTSLALLHHERLVGWLITERTRADSLRYASWCVAGGHRAHGQAISLVSEAIRRQGQAGIPIARAAIDRSAPQAWRLVERHLTRHLSSLSEYRSSKINLQN